MLHSIKILAKRNFTIKSGMAKTSSSEITSKIEMWDYICIIKLTRGPTSVMTLLACYHFFTKSWLTVTVHLARSMLQCVAACCSVLQRVVAPV